MKKIISVLGILAVMVFGAPFFVYGEGGGNTANDAGAGGGGSTAQVSEQLKNPIKYDTFSKFTAAVVKTAVNVMLPFVVLGFIYSGFVFVKAQGNEKELEEAKTAIWYSVIGAFILFGAWGFATIIGETVSTLTETTPSAQ